MRVSSILNMTWRNLMHHKIRTMLITLTVVIGVTTMISLDALGGGFKVIIADRLQSGFEIDNVAIIPGSLYAGYSRGGFTDQDINKISKITGVNIASGLLQIGEARLINNEKIVKNFITTGVNFTEFTQIFPNRFVFETGSYPMSDSNDTMIIGYHINHPEENQATPFAVIGDKVTLSFLLPITEYPYRKIVNQTFTVEGTFQKQGGTGLTNFDYWIFIPLEIARRLCERPDSSDLIYAKINKLSEAEKIVQEIENYFPSNRVTVLSPYMFINEANNIEAIVQLFLLAVASVSLLVTGVAIMNMMTMAVSERTREIGVLKSLGVDNRIVLLLFLMEAGLIGLIGGIIGIFSGYSVSQVLAFTITNLIPKQNGILQTIIQNPQMSGNVVLLPVYSLNFAVITLVFAELICLIFGYYPALKASKMNPIDALRYE